MSNQFNFEVFPMTLRPYNFLANMVSCPTINRFLMFLRLHFCFLKWKALFNGWALSLIKLLQNETVVVVNVVVKTMGNISYLLWLNYSVTVMFNLFKMFFKQICSVIFLGSILSHQSKQATLKLGRTDWFGYQKTSSPIRNNLFSNSHNHVNGIEDLYWIF